MGKVYYDEDADISWIKDQIIAVIGYGNQGRAQALNLRESGLRVIIGVPRDDTFSQAMQDGHNVFPVRVAAEKADIILMLIPDEVMPEVFNEEILPALIRPKTICFASGYNIAFEFIHPPNHVDVILVAPRMIGAGVRQCFLEGKGFPSFIGVHQDVTGNALKTALALSKGIGSTKSGVLELSFSQEAELDLFTEQAFGPAFGQVLLCAIQTLIDAGYPVEAVMIELILSGEFAYTMQKIVELGFLKQMELHSHTSQYGTMTRSARFALPQIAEQMKMVLHEICSGSFAREWEEEKKAGLPLFTQLLELRKLHPIVQWDNATRAAFRMQGE